MIVAEIQSWIVCDGDIDPEWIESLNSVLDDNRLLTMPSGERIQFGPNVNFVFETHDLSCASPATISRMGMIFLRFVSSRTRCQLKMDLGLIWIVRYISNSFSTNLPRVTCWVIYSCVTVSLHF